MNIRRYFERLDFFYVLICTVVISLVLTLALGGLVAGRLERAQFPNGAYLSRLHILSDEAVLRDPEGSIILRNVAYVLFNDRYVAGEIYVDEGSRSRFLYRVGDVAALVESSESDARFQRLLNESGIKDADWPLGSDDIRWLDYRRLVYDEFYLRNWCE